MTTPRHPRHGFTLVELMVVVSILAGVILLVPPNLYKFGARSRLDNAANTLVSTIAAAREQAIIDGHPVRLELGTYRDGEGEWHHGHRFVFTNVPAEKSDLLTPEDAEEETTRPREQEWLTTRWKRLGDGLEFTGVSERAGHWVKIREDQPYSVAFGPDGSVEKGFAVRIISEDLEIRKEDRTITITVNPLTAEPQAYEGYKDVPQSREANEFPQ